MDQTLKAGSALAAPNGLHCQLELFLVFLFPLEQLSLKTDDGLIEIIEQHMFVNEFLLDEALRVFIKRLNYALI